MLKKVITFENFNGEQDSEEVYFHLSRVELLKLEAEKDGLGRWLTMIGESRDGAQIMREMEWFILECYGQKSPDGKGFIKSDELREAFKQTIAYDRLFMDLCMNAEQAAAFAQGVIPAGFVKEIEAAAAVLEKTEPVKPEVVNAIKPRLLSRKDLLEMDHDELTSGLATGRYLIGPDEIEASAPS